MTHLFLFTIGPVQSFIAQARKTRDLKAGSQLLSELVSHAWEAARKANCVQAIKPIIPALESEATDKAEGLPNRFLAEVAFKDETQAHTLGEETAQAVREKLRSIAMKLLDQKVKQQQGDFRVRFEQQIADHLEVHWVINKLGSDYKASYLETESLLGAVKATRTFGQLPEDEAHRKCSVTGERDALVFADIPTHKNGKRKRFIAPYAQAIPIDSSQISQGEGLSAIAFTKRFFLTEGFDSTADIALKEYLAKAKEASVDQYKTLFTSVLKPGEVDGQLFFEENLSDRYLEQFKVYEKMTVNARSDFRKKVSDGLKELETPLKKLGVKQTPYYALIAFDGDSMGKWWSGDTPNPSDLKAFQRKLTGLLSAYAKWASGYLDAPMGKAVYAGGDDFLGFINLQHLFPVLEKLRSEFRRQVSDQTGVANEELTFSAGVAIAHYKTPLNVVLDTARMMEHEAKDAGRNRLGIKVLKHSGEAEEWIGTWSVKDGKGAFSVKHISTLTEAFLKKRCSNTFISVLNRELMQLTGLDPNNPGRMPEQGDTRLRGMARQEIIRSLNRSIAPKTPKEDADSLMEAIKSLYEESSSNPSNFIFGLRVAQFLAREQFTLSETAQPTPTYAN